MNHRLTDEELRELREEHPPAPHDGHYAGECWACKPGIIFPCPTVRALDELEAARRELAEMHKHHPEKSCYYAMPKLRDENRQLREMVAALEAEAFSLAATQCKSPIAGQTGDMECGVERQLREQLDAVHARMECGHRRSDFDDSYGGCALCSLKRAVAECENFCPDETRDEVRALRESLAAERTAFADAIEAAEHLCHEDCEHGNEMETCEKQGGHCESCTEAHLRAMLAAERERCATVAQDLHDPIGGHQDHGFTECSIAAAIRALPEVK